MTSLLHSSFTVQVGWTPRHSGIAGNGLADTAANLAAEGTPSDNSHGRIPTCAHRSVASSSRSGRPGTNRETTSLFLPPLSFQPSSLSLSACSHTPFPDGAGCLLPPGPPQLAPPRPGTLPQTTEQALFRRSAYQYARGSFPETLDLKSAWCDATATEMFAKFVRRTFTPYPQGFAPPRTAAPLPHPLLPHNLFA